eukprot:3649818-Lingulodinium_polyedra.AAC.1
MVPGLCAVRGRWWLRPGLRGRRRAARLGGRAELRAPSPRVGRRRVSRGLLFLCLLGLFNHLGGPVGRQ